MNSFRITGGKQLKGEILPQGAKNEALQVICACLLTKEKVTIHNVPAIRDVVKLIELLKALGVIVTQSGSSSYTFKAADIDLDYLDTNDFKEKVGALRGSIMILDPCLHVSAVASFMHPEETRSGAGVWIPIFSVSRNWVPSSLTTIKISCSP